MAASAPDRLGGVAPGPGNPLGGPVFSRSYSADVALLFAYNYKAEVAAAEREFTDRGGRFLLPLPEPVLEAS